MKRVAALLLFSTFHSLRGEVVPSISTTFQGWAKWSEWSSCSTTCGDGVSRQLRRCLDVRCAGPTHRERICNTKVCTRATDFREDRCSKLNSFIQVNGSRKKERWIPVETAEQCSVDCYSLNTKEVNNFGNLPDGSLCRNEPHNISVCIQGKCTPVGCDGIVGSAAHYDPCGICGGEGDSCGFTTFRWRDSGQYSPCDKTCGPNSYRVSVSVCYNQRTNTVVPERMCGDQKRPRPVVQRCQHVVCPNL
ncbi:hypothetical protein AB6A40_006401 [Gnathostoma spinigerum]|uniref:ADAMTS/ADAMTS-like cysteine-rich domain-containing protein n=1 Tax=Gnathostoma spinigerum TaxID=75299 RepID=A0ABD6EKG6_9BILA